MLDHTPREELLSLPKYDRIAIYLFRELTKAYTPATMPDEIPFFQGTVRSAMKQAVADGVIDKEVANVPDIKYTYDARRSLPAEMEQFGPITWLQNGKGSYILKRTKRPNLIRMPEDLEAEPKLEYVTDNTPKLIAALLGQDEQAMFTRVRNAGIISMFFHGMQTWPIQGHHRTSVSYGQIEIDEVQAYQNPNDGGATIIPISGKGGQDKLSWSQALNLNTYGVQKSPVPGLAVRSLGLWRDDLNTVWIVEFSPHTDIDDIEIVNVRRFTFR